VTHEFLHGLRCRTAHETDWQGRMWAYDLEVPVLSVFFGITIRIYFEGHAPPHLHVAPTQSMPQFWRLIRGSITRRSGLR